jgi:DNA modification methylase
MGARGGGVVTVDYRLGDTRDVIATIPDGSVSLVASSPPFIALRSYLPADHPLKSAEIGSEPDPATFIDALLALTAEWGRVLAPWGSIAIELGDTYAGSGGAGGDYNDDGLRDGQEKFAGSSRKPGNWPRAKCLALVPQAYALSLAYGRNVLNGNESPAGQWLVRNVIVWHRPNPAVGALGDKFRPSTSYITVATRSPKRWFDLTAVRTTPASGEPGAIKSALGRATEGFRGVTNGGVNHPSLVSHAAGAPPLDAWFDTDDHHDLWNLTTQPSKLAHYAMWPAKLAERLILSMCPLEVCATCCEPRRRAERTERCVPYGQTASMAARSKDAGFGAEGHSTYETLGWTDCGHDNFRPGVVLDPFAGTGTTLAVADLHGRDAIGIDIDARNRDLYPARLDECRRSLFGVTPELPGQEALFA